MVGETARTWTPACKAGALPAEHSPAVLVFSAPDIFKAYQLSLQSQ